MERSVELGEFLRSRRARRLPEELGLRRLGGRRRVPGLRREELAQAAGVSVDYYVRLEQGRLRNPSEAVVDAVARALRLDAAERTYLHDLARPRRVAAPPVERPQVPATLAWTLHAITESPALVVSQRTDVLAWNRLAAALLTDFAALAPEQRNMARLVFLDETVAARFADWEAKAGDVVALLRMAAGRHPDDPRLAALIGELTVKSTDFVRLWSAHRVREKTRGHHRFRHPVAGELTLYYEGFAVADNPDLSLVCYTAEPGTRDAQALQLLASWTATPADRTRPSTVDGSAASSAP